jgi:CubicO group peptidase (beta-lactamase class C family)
MLRRKIIFSIALLLPVCFSFAQLTEKLDSLFLGEDPRKPGITLLIEQKGKIIYQKSVGLSNESKAEIIDDATNFRMASVSKQFTAAAILLLEKEHKLSIDDPIIRYLPELPGKIGKQILIRHLLTHSSGLLDYESLIPSGQTRQVLDEDVLRLLQAHDSTYFLPGTQFRYSNSGFCLLALIVERISHHSFASFIKENIFIPLRMDGSTVYEASLPIGHRAMGYAKDSSGHLFFSDQSVTSATKGDGGVYTSLRDYLKWIHAIRENKLINLGESLKRLRFPIDTIKNEYYGAGWFDIESEPVVYFHSGSTCGFTNFVILLPKEECSVIYFSNIAENAAIFERIVKVLKETGNADFSKALALHNLTL